MYDQNLSIFYKSYVSRESHLHDLKTFFPSLRDVKVTLFHISFSEILQQQTLSRNRQWNQYIFSHATLPSDLTAVQKNSYQKSILLIRQTRFFIKYLNYVFKLKKKVKNN